jgi:archaeosortase B (VPXXXP-CTERM-specific)
MPNKPAVARKPNSPPLHRAPAFRFVAFFILYLVLIGGGYSQLSSRWDSFRNAFTHSTAQLVGFCYSLGKSDLAVSGDSISGGGVALQVIEECTGAYEMIIFSAAVLAFPAGWRKKLIGLTLGIPFLFALNILRMVLLAFVQAHGSPALFDFMHLYFWQVMLIVMILGTFVLWIKLAVYRNVKTV